MTRWGKMETNGLGEARSVRDGQIDCAEIALSGAALMLAMLRDADQFRLVSGPRRAKLTEAYRRLQGVMQDLEAPADESPTVIPFRGARS